jgi:hypothetical protein
MAMINNISEGTVRIVSKIDNVGSIHEKEFSQQKAEEVRQVRPVEKSEAGDQANKKKPKKEETSSKYVIDQNQLVYQKYNSKGDLILSIPPDHKPVDEHA